MAPCAVLAEVVPFEFGCLATTDPATGRFTGAVKTGPTDMGDEEFAFYEYAIEDVNQFRDIAQRRAPVGILSLDTAAQPETCTRYREFLQADELIRRAREHARLWVDRGEQAVP